MNNRNTIIFLGALLGLLTIFCYQVAQPFLGPGMFAVLLAAGFHPLYRQMTRWVRHSGLAALLSTLLIYVVILLPLAFVGLTVAGEISEQYGKLKAASADEGGIAPHLDRQMTELILIVAPRIGMSPEEVIRQITGRLEAAVKWIGTGVARGLVLAGSSILSAVLAAIILFFLLRDGRAIHDTGISLLPLKREDSEELITVIGDTLTANLYGVVGVAVAQGILTGIGLAIAGVGSPFTWGAIAALCSMLPVIGPTLVWGPAVVWLLATGSYGSGIFLLIWGVVVVGMTDNILRPLLVSGKTDQHPLLVFFSILGGTSAFGIMGLFLGPILISVTIAVFKVLRREMSLDPVRSAKIG